MKILVVDAQGGGLGRQIIEEIKRQKKDGEIIAIGTNSNATANMLRSSPDKVATGENAIKRAAQQADFIIGPIGMVVADSLMGEITPKIAKSIGRSFAKRILIPFNNCNNFIPGIQKMSMTNIIKLAVQEIQ